MRFAARLNVLLDPALRPETVNTLQGGLLDSVRVGNDMERDVLEYCPPGDELWRLAYFILTCGPWSAELYAWLLKDMKVTDQQLRALGVHSGRNRKTGESIMYRLNSDEGEEAKRQLPPSDAAPGDMEYLLENDNEAVAPIFYSVMTPTPLDSMDGSFADPAFCALDASFHCGQASRTTAYMLEENRGNAGLWRVDIWQDRHCELLLWQVAWCTRWEGR